MTLPVVRDSRPTARRDPFALFADLYDRMGQLMGPVLDGPVRQLAGHQAIAAWLTGVAAWLAGTTGQPPALPPTLITSQASAAPPRPTRTGA